ncbi:MAG: hypothetical protein ABIJ21_07470 [Nanoarchaeota archaeon]
MSIEAVVEAHEKEYLDLKKRADEENILRRRKWYSLTPHLEDVSEEIAEYREDPDGFSSYRVALPETSYYIKQVVPQLEKLASSPEEFERLSALCINWMDEIAFTYVPQGAGKSGIIHKFLHSFIEYLHTEDERIVLGIAGLQASRVNLHAGDGDYPIDDWSIQSFLKKFKESECAQYLPDVAEIIGNIQNGFVADTFFNSSLSVLQAFKEKGAEDLIPVYLRLAKAAQFPDKFGFNFASPHIVENLLPFKELGDLTNLAFHWYEQCLCQNNKWRGFDGSEGVLELTKELLESRFSEEATRILQIAVKLSAQGAEAFKYVRRLLDNDTVLLANHQHILDYAFELAERDGSCAASYLRNAGAEFSLPSIQRRRFHDVGLRLAENFQEHAKEYFGDWPLNPAVDVLRNHPCHFDAWIERLDRVGRRLPHELSSFIGHSVEALDHGLLDKSIDLIFNFQTQLQKWEGENRGRDLSSIDDPYQAYFTSFNSLLRASIRLERYMADLFYFHTSDELRQFQGVPLLVERSGVDYDKYVQLLPDLTSLGLMSGFDNSLSSLRPVIDADLGYAKKIEILLEYSLAARALGNECPQLDLEGIWKSEAREFLIRKLQKKDNGFPIGLLSFEDLIRLGSINEFNRDDEKLGYILEEHVGGRGIPKAFPLGKSYGTRIVGGAKRKEDPVELTLQLVLGLISREPEKRITAERYFEADKLAAVRTFIAPKVIYNQIKGFLPELTAGSAEAAKEVLDVLRTNYSHKEALGDMITTIESLFLGDIKYDNLELRMQKGEFSDLFDNRRNLCCAFYPTGAQRSASMNYLLDEHVGLLHMIPKVGDISLDPSGVAILVQTQDDSRRKYLVVEGIEAGMGVDKITDTLWIPFYHEGVLSVASDVGAQQVIYALNSGGNAKPRKVIEYLRRRFKPKEESVELTKLQSEQPILDRFVVKELEELASLKAGSHRSGDEMDNAWSIYQAIERKKGLYLESIEGGRRNPFGKFKIGGTVTGLVFPV